MWTSSRRALFIRVFRTSTFRSRSTIDLFTPNIVDCEDGTIETRKYIYLHTTYRCSYVHIDCCWNFEAAYTQMRSCKFLSSITFQPLPCQDVSVTRLPQNSFTQLERRRSGKQCHCSSLGHEQRRPFAQSCTSRRCQSRWNRNNAPEHWSRSSYMGHRARGWPRKSRPGGGEFDTSPLAFFFFARALAHTSCSRWNL